MTNDKQDAIGKINEMIRDIKVAMMTTIDIHGHLHSRPMVTQEVEFDGDLWFFAKENSDKVAEIKVNPKVNVSYVKGNSYVSIAATAYIIRDVEKKKELWHEPLKIWFEEGPESPKTVLLHLKGGTAQYWEGPSGGMLGSAISVIKVLLTGDEEEAGDSKTVQFS